jgi:preprotein translocase subunit SecG
MLTFVTIVHVLLCVFMIFVILLQPGKDAGMGSALGGGAATSAFGGRGAVTFLSKLTGICAGLFFLTSLGLSFVGMKTSVAAGAHKPPAKTAPAQAGGAAAPAPAQQAAPAGAPTSVEQSRPSETPAAPAPAGGAAAPAQGQQAAPAPAAPAPAPQK